MVNNWYFFFLFEKRSVTHFSVRLQPINVTAQTYRCCGSNTTYSAPPPLVSKCDLREVGMVFIFFTLMAHRTTTVAPPPSLANVRDRLFLSSLTTLLVRPAGLPSSSSSSLPLFDEAHTTLVASSTLSFPLPLALQSIYHDISIHHICY